MPVCRVHERRDPWLVPGKATDGERHMFAVLDSSGACRTGLLCLLLDTALQLAHASEL
jgi:hypothetical protein